MELWRSGMHPGEIGRTIYPPKERTTIMYHIRRAGIAPAAKKEKIKIVPVETRMSLRGRCHDCGIILKEAPGHNCGTGKDAYFDPHKNEGPAERYGDSRE